jgi:magnesium transporter
VGFFLFKNLLIVVTSEEVKWLDSKLAGRIISPTDLLLRLMDRSIFHFLEHLKVINLISDEIEQKINQSMENRYLINLFVLEKSLVFYLNAITANGAMLEKLRRNAEKIGLSNEEIELLDDTIIENNQCYKQAEIYSNILANLMDARASIVGNNLNILMKTLNIITIAIMVPTFVVSAFSMNVRIPLQDISIAFYIVMFLGALSTVVFILFWKYRKW